MLSNDFKEFVESLNSERVEYLIVGGYALAVHGHPRYTGDFDVWVGAAPGNIDRLLKALAHFGFGSVGLTRDDFMQPEAVIQLGYPPSRIDLLTAIDGVRFDACYPQRLMVTLGELQLPVIDLASFKANKKASGRLKDLADLESLGDDPAA